MSSNILYSNMSNLPDITHEYFHRPGLDRLLEEALEHPLVTVTAGAGYGKTQAVSAFLHGTQLPFVWLQLSNLDNLTTRFWENFVYAVAMQNPYIAGRLATAGFPYTEAQFDDFLHRLSDAIAEIGKVIFVFDDFHLVEEPNITRFFENFLDARLKDLTIILISRTKISLSIPGKRSSHMQVQITEENLRFSLEDIGDYFTMQNITVSPAALEDIHAKTEGWISAVYLIGLSLKRSGPAAENVMAAAGPQIFELIEEEIFSGYTPKIQHTLIELSVLEDFSVELLKELVGLDIILALTKTNTFIYFNPVTKSYRFHNLFSEFLRSKLAYLEPEKMKDTYLKIADWYYKKEFHVDALIYYEKCGSYQKIYNILSRYEIDIPAEEANLFLGILERMPPAFAEKHPLIRVIHARFLLNNGLAMESAKEFAEIIATYKALPDTAEHRAILGETYLFQAMLCLLSRNTGFVELYRCADECLPQGSALIDHRLLMLNGNISVIIEHPVEGEVQRMVEAITEAVPYASRVMHGCLYGEDFLMRAEAAYYMGDMAQAESAAFKAIYRAQQVGQHDIVCMAYFILMRLSIAAGNYEKASGFVEELKQRAQRPGSKCLTMVDIFKSWFYVKLGDPGRVADWIKSEERSSRILSPNSACNDWFVRAYYLLRSENFHELTAYLEYLSEMHNRKGFLVTRLEVQILTAVAACKTGDISACVTALQQAYELSHANELIMHFVEQGSNMRQVIDAARKHGGHSIPEDWLDRIRGKAITYAKKRNAVIEQYNHSNGIVPEGQSNLTSREKEILRHLCQGLSRNEIAKNLYISSNTVKSALQSIYTKFGAGNKADAVRIAMQLGLDK